MAKKSRNSEEQVVLRVRKAPKFLPFMSVGTIFGLILAVLVYIAIPQELKSGASIFGVLLIYLGGAGLLSGTLMALGFDWLSKARSKEVEATKLEG